MIHARAAARSCAQAPTPAPVIAGVLVLVLAGCAGGGGGPGAASTSDGGVQGNDAGNLGNADGAGGGGGADGSDEASSGGDDGGAEAAPPEPNLCPSTGLYMSIFNAPCDAGSPSVDWSPVRRISRDEYDNMVRDLLGDTTQPAKQFVSETPLTPNGINFWTNTCTGVGPGDIAIPQQYLQAAEALAQTWAGNPTNLTNLLNQYGLNSTCNVRGDACAQGFINAFAPLAFRGQFDAAEGTSLFQNVYTPLEQQFGDFTTAMQGVLVSVLTSPRFLFVIELGDPTASGPVVALSQTEIAARLALFLWRSIPDTILLQAAAMNQLSTPAQIATQAKRMLAVTAKAQPALDDFATQWMELENAAALTKDPQYATWNANSPGLSGALVEETLTTFHQTVLGQTGSTGGSLTDLLTSTSSYMSLGVARFYAGATSSLGIGNDPYTLQPVDGPTDPRRGILTDAIVLANQSHTSFPSPTLRGKLIRQQILCDEIDPPPPGVNTTPPGTVAADATINQQYAVHNATGCNSCHDQMDLIGDAFAVYDATGMYQTTEADGRPDAGSYVAVTSSAQVVAGAPGEFSTTATGPVDLVTQLAAATQTRECFALQEFRYALGRIETAADACSVQGAYSAFAAGQLNVQGLMLAIVQSDAFRFRSGQTPGASCQ